MIPEKPTALDRLWHSFRELVRAEFPEVRYLGTYEYRVTTSDGTSSSAATTVDCVPTDPALKLPPLEKVPIRLPYGVTPPAGALCSVQFLNGDASKPTVTNFADPMALMVFAGGTLPNARQGDMVAITLYSPDSPANIATLSLFAPLFANAGGPLVFTAAPMAPLVLYGLVSSGRPTVKS